MSKGDIVMYITATEFKNNLGHYLELSKTEDIYVTKNNKVITVLMNPEKASLVLIEELKGCFNATDKNVDYDEMLKEEIFRRCGF